MIRLPDLDRRHFVQTGLVALACSAACPAFALPSLDQNRSISLQNLYGENLSIDYFRNGAYDSAALDQIAHIFRELESGASHPIDPRLIDRLYDLQSRFGSTIEIVSGYRQAHADDAINDSHTLGLAADIRLFGTSLAAINEAARSYAHGNVHFYPGAQFVHIDMGSRV